MESKEYLPQIYTCFVKPEKTLINSKLLFFENEEKYGFFKAVYNI